jgi:hypothetical protein
LGHHTARQIVVVPSGVHDNTPCTWRKTSGKVVCVPGPEGLSDALALCVLSTTEGVINDAEVGAETGDANSNAHSVVFSPIRHAPSVRRLIVAAQFGAELAGHGGEQIAGLAAPPLGQLAAVARGQDVALGLANHAPGGEEKVDVGALGAAWRHEHEQRVGLAAL